MTENNLLTSLKKEQILWETLKNVTDPELPVNIVDLGLIYEITIENTSHVTVKMTLTTPACTMGPFLAENIRHRCLSLPWVDQVSVDIVWDPPWTEDKISEEGKMELGLI